MHLRLTSLMAIRIVPAVGRNKSIIISHQSIPIVVLSFFIAATDGVLICRICGTPNVYDIKYDVHLQYEFAESTRLSATLSSIGHLTSPRQPLGIDFERKSN